MRKPLLPLLLLSLALPPLPAQDFMLQGCYWSCPEDGAGSLPDSLTLDFWMGRIAQQAPELAHAGFTYLWLPNLTAEAPSSIRNLLKAIELHGLQAVAEIELKRDSAASFERQSRALSSQLGLKAFSINDGSRIAPQQYARGLRTLMDEGLQADLLVSGRPDFDAAGKQQQWLVSVLRNLQGEDRVQPRIYDYGLREALRQACTNEDYDARLVFERSIRDASATSGYHVVALVNHPAYKNQNGRSGDRDDLLADPLLAYAYLLTNNQIGLPSIFYGDYYGEEAEIDGYAGKQPLQRHIDQLMEAHRKFIVNSTTVEYLNRRGTDKQARYESGDSTRLLLFQLDGNSTPAGLSNQPAGGKDVLVAINFSADTLTLTQSINTANLRPGDYFTDVLGESLTPKADFVPFDSAATDPSAVYLRLPPRSYSVWVQGRAPRITPSRIALNANGYTDYIELTWEVAYERKVLMYEIERSVNGKPFERISNLSPLGSTSETASYLFLDKDVFPEETVNYRIKLLDTEGKYEYSPAASSQLERPELNFELLRSPGQWRYAVRVRSNYQGTAALKVFDDKGKLMHEQPQAIKRGENVAHINLAHLPRGVYYLRFSAQGHEAWSTRVLRM